MNQRTTAFVKAGVQQKPLIERIWTWLRDHGQQSSRQIGTALKEPPANVASVLKMMYDRGMVTCDKIKDAHSARYINYYRTNGKGDYELLPRKKKNAPPLSTAVPEPAKMTAQVEVAFNPEKFLSKLTLAELRAVHDFTRRLFK